MAKQIDDLVSSVNTLLPLIDKAIAHINGEAKRQADAIAAAVASATANMVPAADLAPLDGAKQQVDARVAALGPLANG